MQRRKDAMYAQAEARKTEPTSTRPLYGSVWLALFVLLRDGQPDPADAGRAPVNRDGNPSHRP
jgi:hypothetical protein